MQAGSPRVTLPCSGGDLIDKHKCESAAAFARAGPELLIAEAVAVATDAALEGL